MFLIGDPGGCKWEVYDGPIWIDFELPVDVTIEQKDRKRPITADELNIDTTTLKKDPWRFDLTEPESSAASDMTRAIRRFAFPALHKLLQSTDGEDVESEALNRAIVSGPELMARKTRVPATGRPSVAGNPVRFRNSTQRYEEKTTRYFFKTIIKNNALFLYLLEKKAR